MMNNSKIKMTIIKQSKIQSHDLSLKGNEFKSKHSLIKQNTYLKNKNILRTPFQFPFNKGAA